MLPSRNVRITGFFSPITVYGEFSPQAEAAIQDGWLSVMGCWCLRTGTADVRPAQALWRLLYDRPLPENWTNASLDLSEAQRANLRSGISPEGTVIADLVGLPGRLCAHSIRPSCSYDTLRNRIRGIAAYLKPGAVSKIFKDWNAEINISTDIAADDRRFLRGFLLLQLVRRNLAVGGAKYALPPRAKQEFDALLTSEDYPGLWRFIERALPLAGVETW
jgi:hypothetical protein